MYQVRQRWEGKSGKSGALLGTSTGRPLHLSEFTIAVNGSTILQSGRTCCIPVGPGFLGFPGPSSIGFELEVLVAKGTALNK